VGGRRSEAESAGFAVQPASRRSPGGRKAGNFRPRRWSTKSQNSSFGFPHPVVLRAGIAAQAHAERCHNRLAQARSEPTTLVRTLRPEA
jgi:hypothetical protein